MLRQCGLEYSFWGKAVIQVQDGCPFRDNTHNMPLASAILAAQTVPKDSPLALFPVDAIKRAPSAVEQEKEASGPAVFPAAIGVGSGLALQPGPAVGSVRSLRRDAPSGAVDRREDAPEPSFVDISGGRAALLEEILASRAALREAEVQLACTAGDVESAKLPLQDRRLVGDKSQLWEV